jgi:protein SCO1/2
VKQRVFFFWLVVPVLLLMNCSRPASKLPAYDKVPSFTMTDSEGRPFRQSEMAGKIWIVDFIYTFCPAECPLMSSRMRKLEGQIKDMNDVSLLSISVDPERDTPPVLNKFAHRWGAPNGQWKFITGDAATVHLLAYQTFHVGDVINKMEHSTKFAVVDRQGVIRGYYSSFDRDSMADLLKDIESLRRAS